jgi:hypothetical protein
VTRKDAAELWVRLLMVRNSKRRPEVQERFIRGVQLCSQTDNVQKDIFHSVVKIYAIPTTTLQHEAQQPMHNGMVNTCVTSRQSYSHELARADWEALRRPRQHWEGVEWNVVGREHDAPR